MEFYMRSVDHEKERLTDIASKVLKGMAHTEGFPETPTLKKEFRCPYDGSTNVQKIRAILESAMHSLTIDGKTTSAAPNSVLLNRYRAGKEPKRPYFLLFVGPALFFFGFVMAGMMERGPAAWISFLPMAFLGGGAILAFIYSCRHIEEERAAWARKVYIAEHHWHCRNCGGHFEPGRPGSYCVPEPQVEAIEAPELPFDESPEEEEVDDEPGNTAPNITHFNPD